MNGWMVSWDSGVWDGDWKSGASVDGRYRSKKKENFLFRRNSLRKVLGMEGCRICIENCGGWK